MELYFFRHERFVELYTCNFNVDSIPLSDRQHVKVGIALLIVSLLMELLYIPCLISINKMASNACYKLMRYIGIIDLFVIPISGTLTGYLAINGYSFCSYPTLIYFSGSFGLGLYCSVTMASVILALNRCFEMISPRLNNVIFSEEKIKFWLMAPTLYGLYFILFTTPVAFSSVHMSWFFNPFKGYNDTVGHLYHNPMHTVNNAIESSSLIVIYTTFCIVVSVRSAANKTGQNALQNRAKRRAQILSFFQVFLISVVNVVACSIYVLMNIVSLSPLLIVIGMFGWFGIHGKIPTGDLPDVKSYDQTRHVEDVMLWSFHGLKEQSSRKYVPAN